MVRAASRRTGCDPRQSRAPTLAFSESLSGRTVRPRAVVARPVEMVSRVARTVGAAGPGGVVTV
jgi:hypothetical protein